MATESRADEVEESGWFLDRWGQPREFELEYEKLRTRPSYPLRAGVEMLLLIGAGTAYYFRDPLANEENYDDPSILDKLSGRAWCLDTNLSSTNFILHPLAGSAYYGFSRVNGLDVLTSFAYAAASSAVWEYLLEWREKVSVNDLILTPLGGLALGEFLFRLGDYVNSAPRRAGFGNELARYTLGLPQAIHDAIDGRRWRSDMPPDALGFSSAYWHRFAFDPSLGRFQDEAARSAPGVALDLRGSLVALPGFRKLGRFSKAFSDADVTDARLRFMFDDAGLAEVDALAEVVLLGHYSQAELGLTGASSLFGVRTALRYYDSWRLDRRDMIAAAELPGPTLRLTGHSGPLYGELSASAHADFAGIRSIAYPDWQARSSATAVKSVLERRRYSYYVCASGDAEGTLRYGPISLGVSAVHKNCRSIQGMDRLQHQVRDDVATTDTVTELRVRARLPSQGPVRLGVDLEERWRGGTMGAIQRNRSDRWTSAVVAYEF